MCGEMNHHRPYQQEASGKCNVTSMDVNFPLSASKQCPTVHAVFSHTRYAQVQKNWSLCPMLEIPFDTQSVS